MVPVAPPNPFVGRTIQIDPGFSYYQNRSPESVARELEVNGYKNIRFIVTNDDQVDDGLVAALHKRGMFVWYQTFGNGFYGKASGLPEGWESWQMGLTTVDKGLGYTFMSLSCPAYREWKQNRIVSTVKKHGFDAVEIVEPFQLGWGGPGGAGMYGDVSAWAKQAFQTYSGYDALPEFKDRTSPLWFKTDVERYRKWVDFRCHEVNQYLAGIASKVRRELPGKPFAFWALANTSPDPQKDPAALAREWQGIDAVEMARASNPDMVCFQTNWPDWSNPSLPGNYPLKYKPLIDPLRAAFPKLPIIVQADYGSNLNMRRSRKWMAEFEKACYQVGGTGSTAYMYDIALWMYTEKPEVRKVERTKDGLLLVFQKRLDPVTAGVASSYKLSPSIKVTGAKVDGNLVYLKAVLPKKAATYRLSVSGVKDDPSVWVFKGQPSNTASQTLDFKA